jgi:hypothetical protein
MISSGEEALQLLAKWKNDGHPLFIDFTGKGVAISFDGKLSEISSNGLRASGKGVKLEMSLIGASFEYSEPREAETDIREAWESRVVCCLAISLPSGDLCVLCEKWLA